MEEGPKPKAPQTSHTQFGPARQCQCHCHCQMSISVSHTRLGRSALLNFTLPIAAHSGSNGLRRRQLHEVLKPQRASHQEAKDRLKGLAVEWT